MNISFHDFRNIFYRIADEIEHEKDYLSKLDRAIGDGDHGISMSLGWQAVKERLRKIETEDCGDICKEIAMTFLSSVGASIGPLYATAFLEGAKVVKGKKTLTTADIVHFWLAGVRGMQERGKAQVGDKTMMDAWIPAVQNLKKAFDEKKGLSECFSEAVKAGKQGMESTVNLKANKGRSTMLRERAVGHQDPGATSAYIILLSFYNSLIELEKRQTKL